MPEKMTGSKAFFGVLDDEDAYRLICPVDRPAERSIRGMTGFISLVWLTFDDKLQGSSMQTVSAYSAEWTSTFEGGHGLLLTTHGQQGGMQFT